MTHHNPDREVSPALDRTRETLESIKYTVEAAIQLIDDSKETRSLHWKCENCGHVIHHTMPMTADALPNGCDTCWGKLFVPL